MDITLDATWLIATLLLSVRVAAATALTAVFGPAQVPASVRVLIAITLAAVLAAAYAGGTEIPRSVVDLGVACAVEAVIGAAFALGFLAAYAAGQVAGRVLDTQMGFGVGGLLNPEMQSLSSLLGTVFGMTAVGVFLGLDGHHVLVRTLALSVQAVPPGGMGSFGWSRGPQAAGVMFFYGLVLAAPVMGALVLADVTLAVLARSMPQLNVFVMGFALKVLLGLGILAVTLTLSQGVFAALFDTTFRHWARLASGG